MHITGTDTLCTQRRGLPAWRLWPLLLLLITTRTWAGHPEPLAVDKEVYSFGVMPQFEQRQLYKMWRPVLDRLEQLTGIRLRLAGTTRATSFERNFDAGVYDFAYMNAYYVARHDNYVPLVQDANHSLQGVIVVHKDSAIRSIGELHHQEMVLSSPNDFAGSLLLRKALQEDYDIQILPKYAQTHSSAYLHVAKNLAVAAGGELATFTNQDNIIKDSLRILYRTPAMRSHPIAAHQRVPVAVREKLRQALIDLASTEPGRALLAVIPLTNPVPSTKADLRISGDRLQAYAEE